MVNNGVYPHGTYSLIEEEDKYPSHFNIVWNVLWQGKNRVLSGYSGRAANSDLGGQGRLPGESDIWTETQKVIRGWPGEGKEAGVM